MTGTFRFRRTGARVVDVAGADRVRYLQGQCTNDLERLPEESVLPAAILTPRGKLLFVVRAARLPDRIRLLLEGSSPDLLLSHLRKYSLGQRVELLDRSAELERFDLFGPLAAGLPAASPGRIGEAEFGATPVEVWPRDGERSASWLVESSRAEEVESRLGERGSRVSDAAAEILRIEAGRPAFGTDMDESCLPDEVGMVVAISGDKGCYVGQEIVARLRTYGHVNRRFVGFSFSGGPPAPPGSILERPGEPGTEVGRVTSSCLSPEFGPIGLGYARREVAEGDPLALREDPTRRARVVPRARR